MNRFYIVFLDDDNKEWNYIENCCDDSAVTHRTFELQSQGRNVRICTPEMNQTIEPPIGYNRNKDLYW